MVNPLESLERLGVSTHTVQALTNNLWPQYKALETTVIFDGGTVNAIGDYDGTGNPVTLLTVTGTVEMSIIAVCETSLTGASATIELGTAITTAGILAQAVGTTLIVNEIWHDGTPDASVELTSVTKRNIVNQDVILTVATANVTAGVIRFIVKWAPISNDGNVVVA